MVNLMQHSLQQKKAKIIMEELNLKDKERRMRTSRLIEIGGLAVKAKIDHLPTNIYLVLLLSKGYFTQHPTVQDHWTKLVRYF
ncbi:conjugal transfer TraD family protein [Orientia chuto str. Dubai]|uniref:Conjugal transfer TraD family protein n=1 Tax=Orientia chuto str. Dubai TaxID=1359168 RepID=A0A0F3MLK6_9RICK|nr:conjugal transfer TraD family protein [Orientia chuto str. Dubai]